MKKVMNIVISAVAIMGLMAVLSLLSGCNLNESNQQIQATGTVEMTETNISSKAGGKIVQIHGEEGQEIKSGDLLLELDHEELDAQIRAAKANVELTKANLESANTNLQRIRALYNKDLISKSQLDQAVTGAQVSEAQKKQAQANLSLLDIQLQNAKLYAPVPGVISAKMVEQGELISVGSPLYTVLDYSRPWVKIYLPLKDVERVSLNQKAFVILDAYPQKKFHGRVSFISQEAEFTPKDFLSKEERVKQVFAVKIELENKEGLLKAGLPVDVWVEEGQK